MPYKDKNRKVQNNKKLTMKKRREQNRCKNFTDVEIHQEDKNDNLTIVSSTESPIKVTIETIPETPIKSLVEPSNELNGYIYCLSNPAFEGLYKIGFTTTSISQRLSQLNNTSVPFNFKCEFYKKVFNCREKEKKLHSIFSQIGQRVNDRREFFKVDLLLIKDVFDLIEKCD